MVRLRPHLSRDGDIRAVGSNRRLGDLLGPFLLLPVVAGAVLLLAGPLAAQGPVVLDGRIPIVDGALPLGTWQQVVLVDLDTTPRTRRVVVNLLGE